MVPEAAEGAAPATSPASLIANPPPNIRAAGRSGAPGAPPARDARSHAVIARCPSLQTTKPATLPASLASVGRASGQAVVLGSHDSVDPKARGSCHTKLWSGRGTMSVTVPRPESPLARTYG